MAFLLLHRSAGSTSRIRFASCGGVKTSSLLRLAMQVRTSGLYLVADTSDLHEMNRRKLPFRCRYEHILAQVGKEWQFLHALVRQ